MQLKRRVELFQLTEQRCIEVEAQFRMMAALQQQLIAAPAEGLFYLFFVGIDTRDIGVGMAGNALEITEFAIGDTNVRGVDIAIYLPGHLTVRNGDLPQFIAHLHQVCKRGIFEEEHAFFDIQEFLL